MMDKLINVVLVVLIFMTLITLGIVLRKQLIPEQPTKMTREKIVLECEKLSAIATNDGWSYKNCIDNLENPNDAKILKI